MSKSFAVVFAGVPGSSKSIVAQHLSCQFGLPIFSTDIVRSEVKEDLLTSSINEPKAHAEYEKRSTDRRRDLLGRGRPIIIDGSVDRRWLEMRNELQNTGFEWFMIDMELSKSFLVRLFQATSRQRFIDEELDVYLNQHSDFMRQYSSDISLQINDKTFAKRLKVSEEGLRRFIATL